MGRKTKTTVEYFPHFVKFGQTLFLLEDKWGNDGSAFWWKLLMILGAAPNHFLDCCAEAPTGRENWDYLVARARFPGQKCIEIIDWLSDRGNLDRPLWRERRIIWCQDFVNNLSEVYLKRKKPLPERPTNGITGPEIPGYHHIRARNDFGDDSESISGPETPHRREEKREEEGREPPPASASLQQPEDGPVTSVDGAAFPPLLKTREEESLIIDMMQIHKKATGGVELKIDEKEMAELLALFRKYDGKTVVAAYRICQEEKPGKPLGFFLDDFGQYHAKLARQAKTDEGKCPECQVRLDLKYKHLPGCSRRPPDPEPAALTPADTFEDAEVT